MSFTMIGNINQKIDSKVYKLPLTGENEKEGVIEAVGLKEITSEISKVDMTEVASVLGDDTWQTERHIDKIHLLIGADYSVLLPIVEETVGDLQLMKS